MKQFYQKRVWLALALVLPFSTAAQGISPTNLLCESKSNPLGITETSPRLTGQVVTNQTSQIAYAGSALATDQACYWHVRVWDGNSQSSAWSSPAYWSMGMQLTTNSVGLAQITWVAQGTFTNSAVLDLAGAVSNEVYGVDFGGSGAQTVNGYTFADYAASGNMSIAGGGFDLYGSYMTGGATTGNGALDNMLTHGLYGGTANAGILNNLTVGQTYTVMALLDDTRGS